MRSVVLFLLFASLTSPALAQVVPLRATMHECDLQNCRSYTASASAVYLGTTPENGHLFLTAAHTLAPLSRNAVLVEVDKISLQIANRWMGADLVNSQRKPGIDLALLEVPGEIPLLKCLPITNLPLSSNAVVYMAGYPEGHEVRITEGQIVPTEFLDFPLAVDQRPIEGESGGAIVMDNQLEGIISGYPQMTQPLCFFTNVAAIRTFLRENLKSDPTCLRTDAITE